MSSECPGLTVDRERRYLYCPKRAPEEPEDGDWDRFCMECAEGDERDRLADWALDSRQDLVAGPNLTPDALKETRS